MCKTHSSDCHNCNMSDEPHSRMQHTRSRTHRAHWDHTCHQNRSTSISPAQWRVVRTCKSKMKGRARDPPMSIRLGSRQRWRKGWKLRPRHCVPSYLDRWRGRRNCSSLEDRGRSQDRFLAWRGSRSRIRSHNCLLCVRKCTWQRQRGAQELGG